MRNDSVMRLNSLFAFMLEDLNGKKQRSEEIHFAISRQAQRMRKRARIDDRELHSQAVSNFVYTNSLVGSVTLLCSEDIMREARFFIRRTLENFTASLDTMNIQTVLDTSYLADLWRFGPGASNGIRGTHTAEKISQDMTCTVLCESLVANLRKHNAYFQLRDERKGSIGLAVVSGSRLTTVPKNETTRRTIAIEPSGNMVLQLAAGRYLEDAMRSIGLDIRTQQVLNKDLARRGSIDNSIATIDLKSASDMISIDLVKSLMPLEWFELLMKLRSPVITIDGIEHRLNMISTMGNGFTFPLMTFILTALIYANRRINFGGPPNFVSWASTAVFGDDIIIPSHEYDCLCDVLTKVGLIVNHDKSFSDGPFRESCGGDYYKGYDVTPFYVKRLDTDPDVYSAINQMLLWSSRHNCFLSHSILYLKSLIRGKVHFVPEWLDPTSGIQTQGVGRRYTYLSAVQEFRKLREEHFAVPLLIGGYVESHGSDLYYLPRPFKTKHKVRHARLPKGYLHGWDPLRRSQQQSDYIMIMVDIFFRDITSSGVERD